MPNLRPVLFLLGLLLLALAAAMAPPALADFASRNPDWRVFATSAAFTFFAGGTLTLAYRGEAVRLDLRQAFLLTAASWVIVSAFSALPFLFSNLRLNYSDAFFEAVSGLTTTGSTVLVGLDTMPPGILLWRGMLQWLGGVGIIGMAVAILPYLRVGGMQLFRMESSDRSEKVLPRAGQITAAIGASYLALSVACALAYWAAGMTGFEAIAHSMTTLATGGYSTTDASFGRFSPAAQWVSIVFMTLGGLPFVLYVRMLRGQPFALARDSQVRALVGFLVSASLAMAIWLWLARGMAPDEALRHATFNVISIVTTTGFATADYGAWGDVAVFAFFLLTFVGGCTGSTAGGIKPFRFQIAWRMIKRQVGRLIHPNAVLPLRYEGRAVTDEVALSVLAFVIVYLATVVAIGLALAAMELDFLTAFSGAATAVGNVGPGLGPIIGPAGNFSSLPDAAKWVLSVGMLLGRLELFTFLVLLAPGFWRD